MTTTFIVGAVRELPLQGLSVMANHHFEELLEYKLVIFPKQTISVSFRVDLIASHHQQCHQTNIAIDRNEW